MFTFTVDLGQIFIMTAIGIVGYFIKITIERFDKRLDKHEGILFKLVADMQRIMGIIDRRSSWGREDGKD